jgi:uncharacterized membrane protein YtjA (UPF0391 family)
MLSWAITFLIIAIVAAVLGFGGIAGTATGIAKILFVVFLVMFIASFFFGHRSVAEMAYWQAKKGATIPMQGGDV